MFLFLINLDSSPWNS